MIEPLPEKSSEENDQDEEHPLLDRNSRKETRPFSTSTILIYISVFGSRQAFNAVETILPLYLRNILGYTENSSTVIYNLFDGISYILPLFLAIFGDSLFGMYRANVYFSIIFTVGNILLTVAAMSFIKLPIEVALTMLALVVQVFGYSGLSPVQTSFGGDQFDLPRQQAEVTKFFAIFYFMVNLAATLANFVTPMLRSNVQCFGADTCYPLGFGVSAVLMVLTLVPFILGKGLYKMRAVSRSQTALSKTFGCIAYAVGNRNLKTVSKVDHWLDRATDRYGHSFVNDVKTLLHLSTLFAPCIIYYALWDQLGGTWTFQATRMSGYVAEGIYIQPDQVQVTNSLLLLLLIPLFDLVIYPCLSVIGLLKKPLQRMAFGFVLIAMAFVCAGVLELQLAKTYPVVPEARMTSLNVINTLPCSINLNIDPIFVENDLISNSIDVKPYQRTISPRENTIFQNILAVDYSISASVINCTSQIKIRSIKYLSQPTQVHTFLVTETQENSQIAKIISSETNEDLLKSNEGNAKIRIMGGDLPENIITAYVTLVSNSENRSFVLSPEDAETITTEIDPAVYLLTLSIHGMNNTNQLVNLDYVDLQQGGSYLITIFPLENGELVMETFVLTPPNSIHMLWQLPQYFLLTVAELLVAVTGYQFAYEQAPGSMKSLLQSVWLLQMGMGDLVIVLVAAFDAFPNQAYSFFFYVVLMIFGIIWFFISAHRYKPRIHHIEAPPIPVSPVSKKRRSSIAETLASHIAH